MVTTLIGVYLSTSSVISQTRMHLHVLISCRTLCKHGWCGAAVTDLNLAKDNFSRKLLDGVLFPSMELVYYAKMNCSCLCYDSFCGYTNFILLN